MRAVYLFCHSNLATAAGSASNCGYRRQMFASAAAAAPTAAAAASAAVAALGGPDPPSAVPSGPSGLRHGSGRAAHAFRWQRAHRLPLRRACCALQDAARGAVRANGDLAAKWREGSAGGRTRSISLGCPPEPSRTFPNLPEPSRTFPNLSNPPHCARTVVAQPHRGWAPPPCLRRSQLRQPAPPSTRTHPPLSRLRLDPRANAAA